MNSNHPMLQFRNCSETRERYIRKICHDAWKAQNKKVLLCSIHRILGLHWYMSRHFMGIVYYAENKPKTIVSSDAFENGVLICKVCIYALWGKQQISSTLYHVSRMFQLFGSNSTKAPRVILRSGKILSMWYGLYNIDNMLPDIRSSYP